MFGLMNLFVWEVKCYRSNVEMILKINKKVFLNLNQNILNLKNMKNV